jgi:hypothetical protein
MYQWSGHPGIPQIDVSFLKDDFPPCRANGNEMPLRLNEYE